MAFKRLWSFRCVTLLILQLSFRLFVPVVESRDQYVLLPQEELVTLQKVFAAWNGSTPDLENNLAGWSSFNPYDPTFLNISTTLTPAQARELNSTSYQDPCLHDSWKGLLCYLKYRNESDSYSTFLDAAVVGLTLESASITGNLPSAIWEFQLLTSLILTGNPNLTGPIPPFIIGSNIPHVSLNILDLHSNGLSGSIPDDLGPTLQALKELDLSNNQFNDTLPSSLSKMFILDTLKLSNNQLTSNFSNTPLSNVFYGWDSLLIVDLSRNNFQEPLPNFTDSKLQTLNLSHNKFNGNMNMSNFNPNSTQSLTILDLSDNNFTGSMPDFGNWTTLKVLNLSYNHFLPSTNFSWLEKLPKNLESISLSNTSLVGEMNLSKFNSFSNLTSIELDDNFISGTIDFSSLFYYSNNSGTTMKKNKMLESISIINNKITNVIWDNSFNLQDMLFTFSLQGNPYCYDATFPFESGVWCFCYQTCYNITCESSRLFYDDGWHSKKKNIVISSISSGFLIIILSIFTFFLFKSKKEKKYLLLTVQKKFAEYDLKPTLFGLNELQKATRDFHVDMKLGEGGFGAVYKGYLNDGSTIAVKQLLTLTQQSMDDFLNEVVLLTSVKHRNLVKLKGCCFSGSRRLLVYEYVENYDLADILFDHKGNQRLNWAMRFKICMGIAQGLHYLHALVEPKIIHRDIKASNILLDKNMLPKIADFGLALLYPNETSTHITMVQVAGTKGYLAPEYVRLGKLSEKVDVYSFGVLLLEIVSGRRNIDLDAPLEKAYLPDWAWELNESGNLMDLLDPTISLQTEEESEVQQVMEVALCCLQMAPERRPTMAQVVTMFQGDIDVGLIQNQVSDRMHHSYQASSRFSTLDTTGLPNADSESEVLYVGPSSSTHNKGTLELELCAMGAR